MLYCTTVWYGAQAQQLAKALHAFYLSLSLYIYAACAEIAQVWPRLIIYDASLKQQQSSVYCSNSYLHRTLSSPTSLGLLGCLASVPWLFQQAQMVMMSCTTGWGMLGLHAKAFSPTSFTALSHCTTQLTSFTHLLSQENLPYVFTTCWPFHKSNCGVADISKSLPSPAIFCSCPHTPCQIQPLC